MALNDSESPDLIERLRALGPPESFELAHNVATCLEGLNAHLGELKFANRELQIVYQAARAVADWASDSLVQRGGVRSTWNDLEFDRRLGVLIAVVDRAAVPDEPAP